MNCGMTLGNTKSMKVKENIGIEIVWDMPENFIISLKWGMHEAF
jgi:hypothetical protein